MKFGVPGDLLKLNLRPVPERRTVGYEGNGRTEQLANKVWGEGSGEHDDVRSLWR